MVGVFNTIITYLIYSLLVFIGVNYACALVVDYVVGMWISFSLNKKFTFKVSEPTSFNMIFKMFFSCFILFLLNLFLLSFFIEIINFNKYFAQLIVLIIVMIVSYLFQHLYVFKNKNFA